ncbi:unnamed protein product [Diabrotica balteata]|uniref:Uncharacterized protein n=1 Tax=Diabrotica balteata TaxID=107213 RepID=A0A9P0GW13_DIABA|nr:unnamed protein product [Diabrotica balteata]
MPDPLPLDTGPSIEPNSEPSAQRLLGVIDLSEPSALSYQELRAIHNSKEATEEDDLEIKIEAAKISRSEYEVDSSKNKKMVYTICLDESGLESDEELSYFCKESESRRQRSKRRSKNARRINNICPESTTVENDELIRELCDIISEDNNCTTGTRVRRNSSVNIIELSDEDSLDCFNATIDQHASCTEVKSEEEDSGDDIICVEDKTHNGSVSRETSQTLVHNNSTPAKDSDVSSIADSTNQMDLVESMLVPNECEVNRRSGDECLVTEPDTTVSTCSELDSGKIICVSKATSDENHSKNTDTTESKCTEIYSIKSTCDSKATSDENNVQKYDEISNRNILEGSIFHENSLTVDVLVSAESHCDNLIPQFQSSDDKIIRKKVDKQLMIRLEKIKHLETSKISDFKTKPIQSSVDSDYDSDKQLKKNIETSIGSKKEYSLSSYSDFEEKYLTNLMLSSDYESNVMDEKTADSNIALIQDTQIVQDGDIEVVARSAEIPQIAQKVIDIESASLSADEIQAVQRLSDNLITPPTETIQNVQDGEVSQCNIDSDINVTKTTHEEDVTSINPKSIDFQSDSVRSSQKVNDIKGQLIEDRDINIEAVDELIQVKQKESDVENSDHSTQEQQDNTTTLIEQEDSNADKDMFRLKQNVCGGEDTDDHPDSDVCSTQRHEDINTNPIDQESYSSESDRIQLEQKVCGGEDTKVSKENSDDHSDSDVCSTQQHEDINTNPIDQESYSSESDRIQLEQKVCGGEDTKVSEENSDDHSDSDVCSAQQHEDINTNPIDQKSYSSESDRIQLKQTVCDDKDTKVSDETSYHSNRENICLTLEHKEDNNPNLIKQKDINSESDLTQLKEKTIDDVDSMVCDENSDHSDSDIICSTQEHKNTDLANQEGSNSESDLAQFKAKIIDDEGSKVCDENSDHSDSDRICSTQEHKNTDLSNQEGSNSESDLIRLKEKIIDEDSKVGDENSDSILSTKEHKNTVCTNQEKIIDDEDSKVCDENGDHSDGDKFFSTQHKNTDFTNQEKSNSEKDLSQLEEEIIDDEDSKICHKNNDHSDKEHKNTDFTNQEGSNTEKKQVQLKDSDENSDHLDSDTVSSTQAQHEDRNSNVNDQSKQNVSDIEDTKYNDENSDHSDSERIFSTEHKNTDFTNQKGFNSEKEQVQLTDSDENSDHLVSDTVSSTQAQHEDRNSNVNDQSKQNVSDIEDTKYNDENSDHSDSERIFSTEEHKNTYFTNQERSNSEKDLVQLENDDDNSDHLDSDMASFLVGHGVDQSKQNVRDIEDTKDRDENSDHLDSNIVYLTKTHHGDGNANLNDEKCYNSESDLIQLKQSLSDFEDTKESDTNSDIICASLEQIEKISTKTVNEDRCSSESHQIRQSTVYGDEDTKDSWSSVERDITELADIVHASETTSIENSDFLDSEVCSRQVLHEDKTINTVDDQSAISRTDLVQPSLEVDDEGADLIIEETMELETDFIEVSQEEVTTFCYLEGANELEHPEIDDIEYNDDLCQISEDNQTINVEKPLQEIENFTNNDSSFTEEVTQEFEDEHTSEISKTRSLVDEPSCLHEKELIATSQMLEKTEDSGEYITHIKENVTHVNIETTTEIKELNEEVQITENDEIISESELDIQTDVVVEIYKQDLEDNINTDEHELNTTKDSEATSNLQHKIEFESEELLYQDEQIVECSENVVGENIKESKKEVAVVSDHLQQVTNDLQCVHDNININAPNTNLPTKIDNNEENLSANLADRVLSQSKNEIQETEKSSEHIEDSFVNEVIVGTNVEKQDDILLDIEAASNQIYTEVGGKEIVHPEDKASIIFGTPTTVIANEGVFPTSAEPVHPVQLLHGAVTSDWSKINSVDRSFALNNLNWDMYKEAVVTQESRGGLDLLANTAERIRDQETEIYVPSTKKQRKSIPRKLDLKKLQRKIVRRKQKNYVTKESESGEKRVTRSAYRRHLIDDILKPQEFRNTPPINNVKIHQLPDIITTKDTTDTDSNDSECNKLFIDDNKDNDLSVYDQDTQEEHLEFRSKVSPPTTTTVSKKTIKIKRSVRKTAKKEISRTNESASKLMVNIHTNLISEETRDGFFEENTTSNKSQTHVELQTAKKTESCNKTNAETPLIDVNASKTESCSKTNAETNFRNDYQILGHQSLHYSVSTPPKLRYKLACKNNIKSMVEKMERVKTEEIQHQVNPSHESIHKVPLDTPGGEENYLPIDVSTASSGDKKSTTCSMNLVDTCVTLETNKSIELYNKVFITNVDVDSRLQVSNIEVLSNMQPKTELWNQESVTTHKNVDNTIIEKFTYDKNVISISRLPANLVKVPEKIDVREIETKKQSDDPNVNIQKPDLEIRCKKLEKRRKTEILEPQSVAVPNTVDDIASLEELDSRKQSGDNIDLNINKQISTAEIVPKKVGKRRLTQVCDDISSLKEFDADNNIDSSINQVPNVELTPKKVGKRRKTQVIQLTPKNIDNTSSLEDAKKQPDINIDQNIDHRVPKVEFTPKKVGKRRKTQVLQLDPVIAPENIGAISSLKELNAENQPDINIDPSVNHQLDSVIAPENIGAISSLEELNAEKQPDINIDQNINHRVPKVEFTPKKVGKRRKRQVLQLDSVIAPENIGAISSLKELNAEKQPDINIDPSISHQAPNEEFTLKKVGKRRKTKVLQLEPVTTHENKDVISSLKELNNKKQLISTLIQVSVSVQYAVSSLKELNDEKQPDINIDPSISHQVPNVEFTSKKVGKRRKTKVLQSKPITASENVDDMSPNQSVQSDNNIDPNINYQLSNKECHPTKVEKRRKTQLGSIAVSENSFEEHTILQTNTGVHSGNLKEKLNNTEFVQQESVGSPESVDDIPLDIRISQVKRGSQEGGEMSSLEYTTVDNILPNVEEISLTEKQIFQSIPNEEIQETVQQTNTNLQYPNVEVSLNDPKDFTGEVLQNESIGSTESVDDIPLHLRLMQVEHGVKENNPSQDFLVESLLTSDTGCNISKNVEETLAQSEVVNKSSSESQDMSVEENNLSEDVNNRKNSVLKKIKILSDVLISPKKEAITSTITQKQSKLEDLEVTDTLPSKIVLDSNQNTSERFSTKEKRKRGRATNRKNAEILPEGMNKSLVNETQTHLEEGEQHEIVNKEIKIMKDRQDINKNKKTTAAINLESVFSDISKQVSSKTKYSILKPKDSESQDTKITKSSHSERSKRRKSLDDVVVKTKDKQVTFSSQIEEIRRKDVSLDIEQGKRSEKKNQVLKNRNNEKDQTANLDKEKATDSLKNEMENVSYDVGSNKKKLKSTNKDNILGKKEVETQERKPRRISVMYDEKEVDDLIRKYVEDTSIGQHQMTVTAVVENKLKTDRHKSDSKSAVQIQKPKIQLSVNERRVRNDRSKSCTEYDISRSKKSSNEKSLRSKSASTSEIDKKLELDKPKLLQDSMLPAEYTSKRRSRSASKDDNQKIISEECNELSQLTKKPEKQPNIRKLRSKSTCITESEKMLKQPQKLSDSTLKIADSNERRLRSKSLVTPETEHPIKLEQSVPKPHKNSHDVITSSSEIAEQLPRRILRSKTISNESLTNNKQNESVLNTEVPKDLPETKHIATEQKSPTDCSVKEKLELTTLSDDTQDVFNTTLKETITTKAANFLSGNPKDSTPSASNVTEEPVTINTRSKTVKTKYHKEHSSLSDTIATQSKFINAEDQNLPAPSVCSSEIESAVNVLEVSQNIRETRKNKYVPIKDVIDKTKTKDQITFIDKELRVILYRDNNENNKTTTKLQEVSVKSKEGAKETIAKTHTTGLDLGNETEITQVEESKQEIAGVEESTVTGHKHISSSISVDERKNCKSDVSINQAPCQSQITVKPVKDRLNLSEISSLITHNAIQIHAEPKHVVVEQSSLENQINNDIKLTQSDYDTISEVTSSETQNTDVPTVNKPDIVSEVSSSELYNEVQADPIVEQVPLENQIIENTSEIPEISSSETCNDIQDNQNKPINESIEENSLEGQTNTGIKTTEYISEGTSEISSSETYNKIQQDVIKSTEVPDDQLSISDCVMVTEDKSDEISSSKTSNEIQEMKVKAADVPYDQMSAESQINDSIMVTKDNSVEVPEISSSKIFNEIQEVNIRLTDVPDNEKLTENQINVSILATEDKSDEISSSKISNEVKEVNCNGYTDKSDEISKISNKIQEDKVRSDVPVEPMANVYKIDDSVKSSEKVMEPFDYVKDSIAIQEHSISLGEESKSSPSVEPACSLKGGFISSEKTQSVVPDQQYLKLNEKLKSRKSSSRKNKVSDGLITSTTASDNKHLKLDKSIKRIPVMSESVDKSKSVKKSGSVLDNKTKDTKEVTLNIRVLKPISRKERRKSTPQKILKIKSKINLTEIIASNTELLEDKYERKSAAESNLKIETTDLATFDQQQENTEERLITDGTKDHEEEKIQLETLPLIDNENPDVGLMSSNVEEIELSTENLNQQSEPVEAISDVTNKELTSKTLNISETNISSSCEPMNQCTSTELYKNNSKEYFSNVDLKPIEEKVSTDYTGQEVVDIENNSGLVVNDAHISSSSPSDEDLSVKVKVNSEKCSSLDEITTRSTGLTSTNSSIAEDSQIAAVVQTLEGDTGKTFENTTHLEYPPTIVDNDELVTRSTPIFPESLPEAMQENKENTSNANQDLINTITNVPNNLEVNSDDHDTLEQTARFALDTDFTSSKTIESSFNLDTNIDNGISNIDLPVTNIDSSKPQTKIDVHTSLMTEDKIISNKTKIQNTPHVEAVVTQNPMLNISIPKVDNAQFSSESLETPDIEKFLATVPFFGNSAQQQEPVSVSGFQDNEKLSVQAVNQENISKVQDQITPPEIKKDSLILHGKGYRGDGLEENIQNTGNLSENISLLLEILASAENLDAINGSETTANKNGDVVAYNQDNQSPLIPVSVEKIINEFKYPQSPVKVLQKRKVLPEKFQSLSQSFAAGYPNYDSEPSTSTGIYASRRNKKPVASLSNQQSSSWDIPDVSCNEEVVSTELAPHDYSSLEDMSQSLVLASDNPQENQNQALMPSAEQAMSYRDLDPEVFPADFADFCTKMSVTETTSYVVEKSWIPSPFGLPNQFNHPFFNHFNLVPKYRDVRSQQISISRTISTTITDSNMYPYPDIMPTADRRITSKKEIKLVNRFNQANADVSVNCNELTASNNPALENYIAQGNQQSGNSQLRAITDGKNDHNYSYFAGDPVMSIAEEGGDMSPNAKEFGNVILNCENDNEFLDSTAPLLDLDLSDENSTRRGTESFPSWDPEPKVTVENSEQFDDETSSVIMEFIVDHSIADAWNQQETVDNEIQTFPVSNFDLFSQESLNQGGDTFNNSTTLSDEIATSQTCRVEPLDDDVNINICSSLSLSPDDDELPLMNTNAAALYQKPETTDIDLYTSFDELNQKTTPPTTLLKVDNVVPEKTADIPKPESKEDIPSKTDNKSKRVAQQLALYKKLNSKKAKEVNQNDSKQNSMEIPSRQSVRISPRTWTRQSASPMSVKTSPSSQEGSPKTVEQSPIESPVSCIPSEPVILNFKLKNLLQSGIRTDNLNTLEKVKNTKVDVVPEQSTETPSVEAATKTEEIATAKTATKKIDSSKSDLTKKEHIKVDSTNVKDECTEENIKEHSKTDSKADKKKEHSKIISKPERKVEVNDSDTSKIDTTKKASTNDASKTETNRNDQSETRKEISKTDAYKVDTKKEVNKKDSKSDNKKGVTQIDDNKSEYNRSDSNKTEKKKEHHQTDVSKTESKRERSTTNISKSGTNKTPNTEDNKAEIAKQSIRSDTKHSYDETRSTRTSRPDRTDSSSRKKVAEDPTSNSLKQHSSSESNKEDKQFKEYPKNPRTTSISIPVKSSTGKKSEVFVNNDVSQLQSKSIPKPVLSQMAPEDCLQYEISEARSNLYDTVKSRKRAATKRETSVERIAGTSRYHHEFRPRKSKRKSPDEDSDYVKIPEKVPRVDEERPNSSSDLKVKIRRDSSGRQYTTTPSPQSVEADSSSRQYSTSAGSSVSQNSQRYIHDSSSRRYEMGAGGSDIQNSQRHTRDSISRSHSGNLNNSGNQGSQSTGSDSSNRQYTSATPVSNQNSQIYKRDNTGRQYVSTSGGFSSHGSKSTSSSRQYSSSSGSSGSQRPQSSRQGNSDRQHPSYQSSDSQRSQSTRQENSYRQHASYQSSESQRSQSSRLDNSGRQYPPYTSPYQNTPTDNLGPNKPTPQGSSSTGYTVDEILNKSREPRECTKDKIRSNGYKRSSNGLPVSSHKPFKTSEDAFDHLVVEGNVNPFFSNQPNDPKYGINRRLDDQSSLWNKSEKSRRDSSQRYSSSRSSADFSRSAPDMKSPRCGQYRDIRSPIYLPRRPSNNKFPSSSNVISEKFQRINEGQKAPTSSDTHHYTGSGSGLSDEKKNELLEDLRNMVQRQLNKSNKSNSNYDWYQGVEPLLSDNPPGNYLNCSR